MNLVFEVVGGGFVDFPYQTSTELTFAVLAAETTLGKVMLITKDVESKGWDLEDRKETMEAVFKLLNNENLRLSYL
jgi:hypothetical protein